MRRVSEVGDRPACASWLVAALVSVLCIVLAVGRADAAASDPGLLGTSSDRYDGHASLSILRVQSSAVRIVGRHQTRTPVHPGLASTAHAPPTMSSTALPGFGSTPSVRGLVLLPALGRAPPA